MRPEAGASIAGMRLGYLPAAFGEGATDVDTVATRQELPPLSGAGQALGLA